MKHTNWEVRKQPHKLDTHTGEKEQLGRTCGIWHWKMYLRSMLVWQTRKDWLRLCVDGASSLKALRGPAKEEEDSEHISTWDLSDGAYRGILISFTSEPHSWASWCNLLSALNSMSTRLCLPVKGMSSSRFSSMFITGVHKRNQRPCYLRTRLSAWQEDEGRVQWIESRKKTLVMLDHLFSLI